MPAGRHDGRAVVVYTAARLGLFLVCVVLGWVAGLSGAPLLIAALVVSGLLSWFVLSRQRIAMGSVVERRVNRLQQRIDARAAAEDAYVDALQGSPRIEAAERRREA